MLLTRLYWPGILGIITLVSFSSPAIAEAISEVKSLPISIGSRNTNPRTPNHSPTPVDIISLDEINSTIAASDVTDVLRNLLPSYTATPATGDGSAFVRPTSLRGSAGDQTLILVDGKRRHRSSLVLFLAPSAGNGSHGADVSMIPLIALERIEVLRDGAASQYGSDAIAGVINLVTKKSAADGEIKLNYGQYIAGENSWSMGVNHGFDVTDDGFVNLSVELVDNQAHSRGVMRPDAQALVDNGIDGVGADSPFRDSPLTQTWGRPQSRSLRSYINAGYFFQDYSQLYFSANLAEVAGRYRFFYRNPAHSSLDKVKALGYTGEIIDVGYTPYLDGQQQDLSLMLGYLRELDNGTSVDLSMSQGRNQLDYFLNNSVNGSLGLTDDLLLMQQDFKVGGYQQQEFNLNLDLSTPLGDSIHFAYGGEWRKETFTVRAGEPNSYAGEGASGFVGITPEDSGEYARENSAIYADIEHDVSDDLLMQYAMRYEYYSDFGPTTNWKVAANYSLFVDTSLRSSISTGFHAPTPGQSNIRSTITNFEGQSGDQIEEGLIAATDPRAIVVGGKKLKEEQSKSFNLGLVSNVGSSTSLSIDFYRMDVDDRIYRTADIVAPDGGTISFFTNALDMRHQGVDVIVSSNLPSINTAFSLIYNYNKVNVVAQHQVGSTTPVKDDTIEDIENNFPQSRFVITTKTRLNQQFNLTMRANYYGSHYDERGRIDSLASPSAKISPTVFVDVNLSYQLEPSTVITLAATNIFDTYVDEINQPYANRLEDGLQYPRRTPANYEGGSWNLSLRHRF